MQSLSLDLVLARYEAGIRNCLWQPVETTGFSGAEVWKGTNPDGQQFALKKWPFGISAQRLETIFKHQQPVAEIGYTPKWILPEQSLKPFVHFDRFYHIETWISGTPPAPHHPIDDCLLALKRIHQSWGKQRTKSILIPAIARRLQAFTDCLNSKYQPNNSYWQLLQAQMLQWQPVLLQLLYTGDSIQPIFGDLHCQHVLYHHDLFSGFIDFGQLRLDVIEADIARLVGSLYPGDKEARQQITRQYGANWDLVNTLERTAILVANYNWHVWIIQEKRVFADKNLVQNRMQQLEEQLYALAAT